MYQKIKNSLLYPKEIAKSYQDKVIGFLIFLIVLVSLPFILHFCVNGFITSSDIRNVKMAFYNEKTIEYRIENNTLVPYDVTTPNNYIVIEEKELGVAFISKPEEKVEVVESIIIVFEEDGVYLTLPYVGGMSYKVATYENLNNLDFKDAKSLENNEFWKAILTQVNDIFDEFKPFLYPGVIIVIIIQMAMQVLFGILMNTIILLIFERTSNVKFREVFKNCTVAFFPYIIGIILSIAFGITALTSIGNIIAFVYALIAHNEYRRIKMKENM